MTDNLQKYEIATAIGTVPIIYRDIIHPDGAIRIEYFHDHDLENPTALLTFRARLSLLHNEYDSWKTIGLDSLTTMDLVARKLEEKTLNPNTKDKRQWFGEGTNALEEIICWRFASLPMNVVLICHIDERKNEISGEILRGPSARGRLARQGLVNAYYQEQYHLYTMRDETGKRIHACQTQNRDGWVATTQINAPDPCYPHYESIWQGFNGQARPNIHALIYGDTGVGKSTMFRSFPKPMLVFMFDPFGKDFPYRKDQNGNLLG